MLSPSFTAPKNQLTLDFEPGLAERHRNLRDCIGAGIYRRGLSTCAIDLNESPGNLSNQLSDESQRKFGVDEFELYLEKTKDFTPIFYLVEKFLSKNQQSDHEAAKKLAALEQVQAILKNAGLA
jgi:hypothetical protein